MTIRRFLAGGLACLALSGWAAATQLFVEVGQSRAPGTLDQKVEAAAIRFAERAHELALPTREALGDSQPLALPITIILTENGQPIPPAPPSLAPGDDIVPVFDASGSRAFPLAYRQLLEDTFTLAKPAMNGIFGVPKDGGNVAIKNYDADISDRNAVIGGIYVPNAPGGPEVRFPVYNSDVSAAINYIHTLLLAYRGDADLPFDAYREGLVRAAAIAVARTPGSLPNSPDSAVVEQTLASLYTTGGFYDWYNQPGLGAADFIAPNLLNDPLPPGGSTGGVFLLRYRMAGSAFLKLRTQHPAFIAQFNQAFYANPAGFQTEADLVGLGQQTLDAVTGGPNGTIEGLSFAEWALRQFILDTSTRGGYKAVLQPFPLAPTAGSNDFGVFGIILHAFLQQPNGDETLLAGKSYPIYWRPDDGRFFASAQDDVMDITGGFGSVAPNFADLFSGATYRVNVDAPFRGVSNRVHLPAGAIATGSDPSPNSFYGSLSGFPELPFGQSYAVQIEWNGGSNSVTAQNKAFGADISEATFNPAQSVLIKVFQVNGASSTQVFERRISKDLGALAVTLHQGEGQTDTFMRPSRLEMKGVAVDPYRPKVSDVLGLLEAATLAARWDPVIGQYRLFPDFGSWRSGFGAFVRAETPSSEAVEGRLTTEEPAVVHLQPGWNQVVSPFFADVPFSQVQVTTAAESLRTFADAQGSLIGNTVFRFVPDGGNPDGGTYQAATTFVRGEAVFIQCLSADGAALAFFPNPPAPSNEAETPRALGGWERLDWTLNRRWEADVAFRSQAGQITNVRIGQSTSGTSGFDPKLDTAMPPLVGGFQAVIDGPMACYRDIRTWGRLDIWKIHLNGAKPGERIWLTLDYKVGSRKLLIRDAGGAWQELATGRRRISFVATGPNQVIEIIAGGSR